MSDETLVVCVNCPSESGSTTKLQPAEGQALHWALQTLIQASPGHAPRLQLREVKCMGGCNRPCAVALCAPYKETLLFFELERSHAPELLSLAAAYVSAPEGARIPASQMPPRLSNPDNFIRVPAPTRQLRCSNVTTPSSSDA
ncbi:MAG: DUF1636 domain-containing protein [Burkholderiales bacterium]|nr:DUF1636 domain-containing protein [Burkholderiales bacterium]